VLRNCGLQPSCLPTMTTGLSRLNLDRVKLHRDATRALGASQLLQVLERLPASSFSAYLARGRRSSSQHTLPWLPARTCRSCTLTAAVCRVQRGCMCSQPAASYLN
jgi:hypothetical protein